MAAENASGVAITGGTIDGVTIGGTTPATTVTASTSLNAPLVNGASGLNVQTGSGNIVFLPDGTSRWYMGATSGSFLATTDNAVNIGASGANRPANIYVGTSVTAPVFDSSATQTTVNCSTSGSVTFSEPFAGSSLKRVEIHAAACVGTASYTFPTAFSFAPQVLSQSLASIATSVSATAVTITGSTSTGFLALDGY